MDQAERLRVLIVDDHPLFREALEVAMEKATPRAADIEHCATLEAAMEAAREARPDLVLLDLNLSDASGFDGLMRLQSIDRDIPITVISATEAPEAYARAEALGAQGYLPKSLSLTELSTALAAILDGGTCFPEHSDEEPSENGEAAGRVASLTPAQRRVLDGLSDGLLNKQIAYEMGISEATVKAHMTAIFRKLGVNNRTQALLTLKAVTSIGDHSAA